MASLLAFWDSIPDRRNTRIEVLRSATENGSYDPIANIKALDSYKNWVTHYEDTNALLSGGSPAGYYKVRYLDKNGAELEQSDPKAGVVPLQAKPYDVLRVVQGLIQSYVTAEDIQTRIEEAVAETEQEIGMSLSLQTVTKETRPPEDFDKIIGFTKGQIISLDRYPLYYDANQTNGGIRVYYRIRGLSNSGNEVEWTNIDVQPAFTTGPTGFNMGAITIYPVSLTVGVPQAALFWKTHHASALQVLITYQHGFATWPTDLKRAIVFHAAAQIMEIMGEADTAGLSSRSLDGYSESFTASATTTVFSARRELYMKQYDKIIKRWRIVRSAY